MTTTHLPSARPALLDALWRRSIVRDAVAIIGGTALTAAAAQLVVPLWPVPVTGQTFAVLLVGAALGARRGLVSIALYVAVGVLGVPVFAAGGHGSPIGSPSGGFLVGFLIAAAVTGALAQRQWDRTILKTFVAFAAGTAVMYAVGLPWLFVWLSGLPANALATSFGTTSALAATIQGGVLPFLVGDTAKAVLAALLLPGVWAVITQRRRARGERFRRSSRMEG